MVTAATKQPQEVFGLMKSSASNYTPFKKTKLRHPLLITMHQLQVYLQPQWMEAHTKVHFEKKRVIFSIHFHSINGDQVE